MAKKLSPTPPLARPAPVITVAARTNRECFKGELLELSGVKDPNVSPLDSLDMRHTKVSHYGFCVGKTAAIRVHSDVYEVQRSASGTRFSP